MAHAPRSDQLRLLEVAEFDAQLASLKTEAERHPLRAEVGAQMNLVAAKARELMEAKETLRATQAELEEAGQRTSKLADIVKDKQARLNAGTGMDSRQLLTLLSEIDANKEALEEASDAEYHLLERVEVAETEIANIEAQQAVLNEKIVTGRAELEEAIEAIERDAADVRRQREALYEPLADELKAAYERAQRSGGLTVIALHRNGETSAGVQISPIEANQIKNADPEEIHISEDYQCIVVLLDA